MIREPDGPLVPRVSAPDPVSTPVAGTPPVKAAAVPQAEAREATRAQVERAVAQANRHMTAVAPSLQFEIDPDTEQVVIRLVDRQDQRVLRQVPSPEMLAIAHALERMQSLLVRTRA